MTDHLSQVFAHLCQLICSRIILAKVPCQGCVHLCTSWILMGIKGHLSIPFPMMWVLLPQSRVGRVQVSPAGTEPWLKPWHQTLFYLSTSGRNSCVLEHLLSQSTAGKQAKVTDWWYENMPGLNAGNHVTGNAITEMKTLEINWQILIALRNLEGTSVSRTCLALKHCLTKIFFWGTKIPSYLKITNHRPLA